MTVQNSCSVGRGISNDRQCELEKALIVRFLKGEREGKLRSLSLEVWSDFKTWQIEKKKNQTAALGMKNLRKKWRVWRGGLDQMALWQIRTAQARKERMRKQPQRVTNPGLASWLADAAHDGKLEQHNKERCLGRQLTRKEWNYCEPQFFRQFAFGGCTIKWSAHFTILHQQLKHTDCIGLYLIYAFANVFYVIAHFTIADWRLSSVLVRQRESKEEK